MENLFLRSDVEKFLVVGVMVKGAGGFAVYSRSCKIA